MLGALPPFDVDTPWWADVAEGGWVWLKVDRCSPTYPAPISTTRRFKLLGPVAALRQAVIYQRFLDAIEETERIYDAAGQQFWLRRARRPWLRRAALR